MNNIDKVFSFAAEQWARWAPAVAVHLALYVLITSWVLDVRFAGVPADLWQNVKTAIERVGTESGITVARGYIVAALLYAYLVAVQWMAALVTSVPGLRRRYVNGPLSTDDLSRASRIFATHPAEEYETERRLLHAVDVYTRTYREREKKAPFDWYENEVSRWDRFYQLSTVTAVGMFVWLGYGAPAAASTSRVILLGFGFSLFAAFARYRSGRAYREREQQLRYATLDDLERSEPRREPWPITAVRNEVIELLERYKATLRRDPARLIEAASRVHPLLHCAVMARIRYRQYFDGDWELRRSAVMMHGDDQQAPPGALNVGAYESRFAPLLECRGAGLAMLALRRSLAPSKGGGDGYCFARRSHEGTSIRLHVNQDASRFSVYSQGWAFIVDLGEQPIELLAQEEFPSVGLNHLAVSPLEIVSMSPLSVRPTTTREREIISPSTVVPLNVGHSYLVRASTRSNALASVVFQCFGTCEPDRLLIAWRILRVDGKAARPPSLLPWWRREAWTRQNLEREGSRRNRTDGRTDIM